MTRHMYSSEEIARQLEACLHGEIDLLEVARELNLIERSELDDTGERAIHFLNHYVADEDIREKDREYAEHQRERLLDYIRLLRS